MSNTASTSTVFSKQSQPPPPSTSTPGADAQQVQGAPIRIPEWMNNLLIGILDEVRMAATYSIVPSGVTALLRSLNFYTLQIDMYFIVLLLKMYIFLRLVVREDDDLIERSYFQVVVRLATNFIILLASYSLAKVLFGAYERIQAKSNRINWKGCGIRLILEYLDWTYALSGGRCYLYGFVGLCMFIVHGEGE